MSSLAGNLRAVLHQLERDAVIFVRPLLLLILLHISPSWYYYAHFPRCSITRITPISDSCCGISLGLNMTVVGLHDTRGEALRRCWHLAWDPSTPLKSWGHISKRGMSCYFLEVAETPGVSLHPSGSRGPRCESGAKTPHLTLSNPSVQRKMCSPSQIFKISQQNQTLLYSPPSWPPSEPNSISPAPVLLNLAYMAMLFIFHQTHIASCEHQLRKMT